MIDWTQIDRRDGTKPTAEDFENESAARVGVTVEHHRRFHDVVPCDCGAPDCPGWRADWKNAARRRNEN